MKLIIFRLNIFLYFYNKRPFYWFINFYGFDCFYYFLLADWYYSRLVLISLIKKITFLVFRPTKYWNASDFIHKDFILIYLFNDYVMLWTKLLFLKYIL